MAATISEMATVVNSDKRMSAETSENAGGGEPPVASRTRPTLSSKMSGILQPQLGRSAAAAPAKNPIDRVPELARIRPGGLNTSLPELLTLSVTQLSLKPSLRVPGGFGSGCSSNEATSTSWCRQPRR
jgi:hypothetical protein